MDETLTLNLVRRLARSEAFRLRHAEVEPEHIMVGLGKLEDPAARSDIAEGAQGPQEIEAAQSEVAAVLRVFEQAAISPVLLRRGLRQVCEGLYPAALADSARPRRSAASRAAFSRAATLAQQLGAEQVSAIHLLIALAEGGSHGAPVLAAALRSLDIDPAALHAQALGAATLPSADEPGSITMRSPAEAPLFMPQPGLSENIFQRHLRALYRISHAIAAAALSDNPCAAIASAIEAALPAATRGAILLAGEGGGLSLAARWPDGPLSLSFHWAERAIREREAFIWVDDRTISEAPASAIVAGVRAAIYAPLRHAELSFGVMYVDSSMSAEAFVPADLELVRAVAAQTALALYIQEARRERERMAAVRANLVHQLGPDLVDRLSAATSAPLWSPEAFALAVQIRPSAAAGHADQLREVQHVGALLADELLRRGAALDRGSVTLIAVYGALTGLPLSAAVPIAAARAIARYPLPRGWSLGIGLVFGTLSQGLAPATIPHQSYSAYEEGLEKLRDLIATKDMDVKLTLLTLAQRLSDNIGHTRLHGDTESRRAERSEIVSELNRWSLQTFGITYNALCGPPASDNVGPTPQIYRADGPAVEVARRLAAGAAGAVLIDTATYQRFQDEAPAAVQHATADAMALYE